MRVFDSDGRELVNIDIKELVFEIASILNSHFTLDKPNTSIRTAITSMPATPWSGSPAVSIAASQTLATLTNLNQMDGVSLRFNLLRDVNYTAWATSIRPLM